MFIFLQRLIGIIKKHQHSIYIYCWDCGGQGINSPENHNCGNCGSSHTTEYYPVRNFRQQEELDASKVRLKIENYFKSVTKEQLHQDLLDANYFKEKGGEGK